MAPFAAPLLRMFTATHLGNESALRQGTDRSALRRVYAACRSAWIRSSRVVTWLQLAKVRVSDNCLSHNNFAIESLRPALASACTSTLSHFRAGCEAPLSPNRCLKVGSRGGVK